MLEYDRIDVSEEIDVNNATDLCECIICHYWYFLEINFRFQSKVCNGCFNENHNHYYYKMFLEGLVVKKTSASKEQIICHY